MLASLRAGPLNEPPNGTRRAAGSAPLVVELHNGTVRPRSAPQAGEPPSLAAPQAGEPPSVAAPQEGEPPSVAPPRAGEPPKRSPRTDHTCSSRSRLTQPIC